MFEMVGRPSSGRTFAGQRRVRLGDCSPGGRLRLDATARYLQDLSDDDTRDAGFAQMTWVVRRTVIDVQRFATYLEPLELRHVVLWSRLAVGRASGRHPQRRWWFVECRDAVGAPRPGDAAAGSHDRAVR